MLNLARYAAVAALAGGLGIAATVPASAWGGYGYGGPYGYGYSYPDYAYRPFYRHHYYGFYGPRRFYRHWGW
jgi:hypothetical protein